MKVKISTNSGSVVEKTVLTAFNNGTGSYIVFDNETMGGMGLPIILVTKFVDNKVIKIQDTNEWNAVKESLRQLIAGNMTNYFSVPADIAGDDNFFTQLTLPVASFDAIKLNYKPTSSDTVTPSVAPSVTEPVVNAAQQDVVQETAPSVEPAPTASITPSSVQTVTSAPTPVVSETAAQVINPAPSTPAPVVNETPAVDPVISGPQIDPSVLSTPKIEEPITINATEPISLDKPTPATTPVIAQPNVAPTATPVTSAPVQTNQSEPVAKDFSAEKEMFLNACANMFDVLVNKINK